MSSAPGLQKIHIVVTCSNRKKAKPHLAHQFRSLASTKGAPETTQERSQRWMQQLEDEQHSGIPVSKLYQGEHWQIAQELPEYASALGLEPELWVCSAGYGLLHIEDTIQPYAATFSTSHADSVGRNSKEHQSWWKQLSQWPGPNNFQPRPRSLLALTSRDPSAIYLLILSQSYLKAVWEDAIAAQKQSKAPETWMIVSAGATPTGELQHSILPGDARLQHSLGGTRTALNVRIARWLLSTAKEVSNDGTPFGLSWATTALTDFLEQQPPVRKYKREKMNDTEVCEFIRNALEQEPSSAQSVLLRQLREQNYACEQSRFRSLYYEVKSDSGE